LLVVGLCQVLGQICADPNCLPTACLNGPYNCTACQGSYDLDYKGFCVNCGAVQGFYFNATTKKCEGCKQAKCDRCDVNQCTSCEDYYGINQTSGACAACPPHADRCTHNTSFNYMQVQRCDPTYYPNDTSHCIACPSNLTHCTQCWNQDICLSCDERYEVSQTTGLCVACPDHCLECQNGICGLCEDGYDVDFFTGNCSSTTCSSSFCSSVGQMLLPERDGITCGGACTGGQCCAGVASGWFGVWSYRQNGANVVCDNLQTILVTKEGCNPNRFLSLNNTCLSDGTFEITQTLAVTCAVGLPQLSGIRQDCIVDGRPIGDDLAIVQCPNDPRCALRCTTCINGTCMGCMTGYYLQSTSCTACSANCGECASGTQCTTCNGGYYVNANGGCTVCPTRCALCDSATVCTLCKEGSRLNNTDCVACSSGVNCTRCNANDRCTRCSDGNVYNNVNNTCDYLPANVSNYFFEVNGTLIVTDCENGYYIASPPRRCIACSAGCDRCNNATDCTRCTSNYYANATGQCNSCDSAIKYCADCDLRGTVVWCNACVQGKGFVNEPQKCASCASSYNCDQCLPYSHNPKTGCLSCKPGYSSVGHPNHRCYSLTSAASFLHPSVLFGVVIMALATYLL